MPAPLYFIYNFCVCLRFHLPPIIIFMSETTRLLAESVEAAEFRIQCIEVRRTIEAATHPDHAHVLRDIQYAYRDLIAHLHLAISALEPDRQQVPVSARYSRQL